MGGDLKWEVPLSGRCLWYFIQRNRQMAGNFWESSHFKEWLLDKQEIEVWRQKDVSYFANSEEYQKLMIFFSNFIQMLGGEHLKLRQQVISTSIIYFRRFYSRHSLGDVDPFLLGPTCIYLASKVEECGVVQPGNLYIRCKSLIRQKYQSIYNQDYPYKAQHIMECEFLLLEMLDCCLIVFHPYRPLTQYVTDLGQEDILLPTAWKIVNDTYRSDICMLYPPYLLALVAIHMAAVVHKKDVKAWFAELSIDMSKIIEITTLILDLYKMWKSYDEAKDIPELLAKMPKPTKCGSPGEHALKATPSPSK